MHYKKGKYHARALIREIIKNGNRNPETIPELVASPEFLRQLSSSGELDSFLPLPDIVEICTENLDNEICAENNQINNSHQDRTIKFVSRLQDGQHIESVIIPMKQYNTLCVSTQVGCRMGCLFCATGASGFQRDLTTSEITSQLFNARFILKKSIKNIVFMGMGEPLDNLDHLIQSIAVLNEPHGFDIAHRHMTISTCGLVPRIYELAASLIKPCLTRPNLAVSINSADQEIRSSLMPINRKYPLAQLRKALLEWPVTDRQLILIEYILFKNLNDSQEDARKLADYLAGLKVRVNLIGYNYANNRNRSISLQPVEDSDIHKFASYLEKYGIFVVKRWGKGANFKAGCGQLSAKKE
ncbi:23S rRNA (adenine(2503)-C(2))-methyltransferase RlmN [Desulfamplus magnetovallimortis]|uniref:23S rRNA (adenine(2503)-C(2))-methyltransferase RlmN n=1 Tax=Desulfamplus magnetovallimortis TaxID=1246637 RepID=UPI001FECC2A2|nr:23S rRNA (adenine(2503)-C(2))-methyltransferase RlmN [Desulfamplus magnetovallimortis]